MPTVGAPASKPNHEHAQTCLQNAAWCNAQANYALSSRGFSKSPGALQEVDERIHTFAVQAYNFGMVGLVNCRNDQEAPLHLQIGHAAYLLGDWQQVIYHFDNAAETIYLDNLSTFRGAIALNRIGVSKLFPPSNLLDQLNLRRMRAKL